MPISRKKGKMNRLALLVYCTGLGTAPNSTITAGGARIVDHDVKTTGRIMKSTRPQPWT